MDDREVLDAEEVHLEQADFLDLVHGELRSNRFVARVAIKRAILRQVLVGDDDARGVRSRVAHATFHRDGCFHQLTNLRIRFDSRAQIGALFEGFLEIRFRPIGDELRNLIHNRERNAQHATNVAHRELGLDRAEGDDLRNAILAVLLAHVFDHFAATFEAEVHVDVGHRETIGVQESLEQQPVLQRTQLCDPERIRDDRTRRRTAAGTDGNALTARVRNEIRDDQEVRIEAHLVDDAELEFHAVDQFAVGVRTRAVDAPNPVPDFLAQELRFGLSVRAWEPRQVIFLLRHFEVTAVSNLERVRQRFRNLAEDRLHLRRRFDVKFLTRESHSIRVGVDALGLDAEQQIMDRRILFLEVVRVVRRDHAQVIPCREFDQSLVQLLLFGNAVFLDFDEEPVASEDVEKLPRHVVAHAIVAIHDCARDETAHARRCREDAPRVLLERLEIDARFVVESFCMAERGELAEVLVSLVIHREQ
jgi:hypothetical protein